MKWIFFGVAALLLLVFVAGLAGVGRTTAGMEMLRPSAADGGLTLTLLGERPEPAPAPPVVVASPPPPVLVPPTPVEPPALKEPPASVASPAPAEPALRICYRIGPLDESATARLVESLDSGDEVLSRETGRRSVTLGYWVLEPTFPSRTAAVNQVRALREKGIDSFVFTDGELENAVSLGLFKNEQTTQRAVDRFRKQGIEAEAVPRVREIEEIWLTVAVSDSRFPADGLLQSLAADTADQAVPTAQAKACP